MTGHNNTTESINTKYLRLLKSSEELKRLQKEIDDNIMAQNNMTNLSFFGNTRDSQMQHEYHKRIIESNQAKIKQIIEDL